jgi:toxin-antitoxin system PIN domain toxin
VRTPDANLLLYAIDPDSRHHRVARGWLEASLSGAETTGFAWSVLLAVLRLTTNPAVFEPALAPEEALDLIDGWLEGPAGVVLHPTDRHAAILRELLAGSGAAGNLTSDAHLAAIAIEHGATLASFDADFHRFGGLRLEYLG